MSDFYKYFKENMEALGLIGAGIRGEKLAVVAAMSASYYVGAVIGSITVAMGRTLAGGTSLADVLLDARRNRVHRPWLPSVLMHHPEIYKRRSK